MRWQRRLDQATAQAGAAEVQAKQELAMMGEAERSLRQARQRQQRHQLEQMEEVIRQRDTAAAAHETAIARLEARCVADVEHHTSDSKRSAALDSRALELSFGHVLERRPLRLTLNGERQTR